MGTRLQCRSRVRSFLLLVVRLVRMALAPDFLILLSERSRWVMESLLAMRRARSLEPCFSTMPVEHKYRDFRCEEELQASASMRAPSSPISLKESERDLSGGSLL